MFPTGTLPFQISQQIRLGESMSVSIDTIKYFKGKIGEKYSFKKILNNQENPKSPEQTIDEVMETIVTNKNYPASEELINDVTDIDNLMKLFDLFSGWHHPCWMD